QLLHALEIGVEQLQYPFRRRMLCGILEPGVVIGRYRDGAVAQLRLQGEECLRHVGHADDIRTRGAQEQALRTGAEARTLDAGVGLVLVQRHAARVRHARDQGGGGAAGGLCARDMRDQPAAEEARGTRSAGEVQVLRRQRELAGVDLCAQASHRRHADHGAHAEALQRPDVGAEVRSEEHTSELQSRGHLVCRLLLEKKNNNIIFLVALINYVIVNAKYFREYLSHYTNSATLLRDDFLDTAHLDGLF